MEASGSLDIFGNTVFVIFCFEMLIFYSCQKNLFSVVAFVSCARAPRSARRPAPGQRARAQGAGWAGASRSRGTGVPTSAEKAFWKLVGKYCSQ